MDLEGIMLSEISQIEKDKYDLTYMQNPKKKKKISLIHRCKEQIDWWLPEVERWGKMGEGGQNIQISSYKRSQSWRCDDSTVTIHSDYTQ